jgi:hypothetical protein
VKIKTTKISSKDPSFNEYCDPIGQQQVSISHNYYKLVNHHINL